jgi:hypothetical protein
MASVAAIAVVLGLLTAGAEGSVPAAVVAGVVSSLQRQYLSGCVFLLHTEDYSELGRYPPTPLSAYLHICRTVTLGHCVLLG